jgi:hypothetical protein
MSIIPAVLLWLAVAIPALGNGSLDLPSQAACCVVERLDGLVAARLPLFFTILQDWVAEQRIMQCKTPLSKDIGSGLGLPRFRWPETSEYVSLRAQPDLGVLTIGAPPFEVPTYLRPDRIRSEPKAFIAFVYIAYDPRLSAILYYVVGDEFESIGYISGVTRPPLGTPEINLRTLTAPAGHTISNDLVLSAVRGLPSLDEVTRRYGKPARLRQVCGFWQVHYLGPSQHSSHLGLPYQTSISLAYSSTGRLRAFVLTQGE